MRLGYHVHSSDVDISFPPKPFWPSLLAYLEGPGADIAMERDYWGPINTGCVVGWLNMFSCLLNFNR